MHSPKHNTLLKIITSTFMLPFHYLKTDKLLKCSKNYNYSFVQRQSKKTCFTFSTLVLSKETANMNHVKTEPLRKTQGHKNHNLSTFTFFFMESVTRGCKSSGVIRYKWFTCWLFACSDTITWLLSHVCKPSQPFLKQLLAVYGL